MYENIERTVVFPLQQRLHERASMFRSTYMANLVNSAKIRKDTVLRFSTPGRLGIDDNTAKLENVSYTNLSVISASFSNNLSKWHRVTGGQPG
jgi:hypothetical protein